MHGRRQLARARNGEVPRDSVGDRSPLHDRQGIPESASRELTSTTATIAVGRLVGSRVTIARPPKALRDMRCRGTGAETGQQAPPPSPAARLQL